MSRRKPLAADGARPVRQSSVRPAASLPLVGVIGFLIALTSADQAAAAQRLTCSRALQACGKPRICQTRYQACLETGCWTVWRVKRCGYERR
jgi:hypothetical protein